MDFDFTFVKHVEVERIHLPNGGSRLINGFIGEQVGCCLQKIEVFFVAIAEQRFGDVLPLHQNFIGQLILKKRSNG